MKSIVSCLGLWFFFRSLATPGLILSLNPAFFSLLVDFFTPKVLKRFRRQAQLARRLRQDGLRQCLPSKCFHVWIPETFQAALAKIDMSLRKTPDSMTDQALQLPAKSRQSEIFLQKSARIYVWFVANRPSIIKVFDLSLRGRCERDEPDVNRSRRQKISSA
jgi:hypothetical protein